MQWWVEGWRESLGALVFSLSTDQGVTKTMVAIVKVEKKRENRAPTESSNLVTLRGTTERALEATVLTELSFVEGGLQATFSAAQTLL